MISFGTPSVAHEYRIEPVFLDAEVSKTENIPWTPIGHQVASKNLFPVCCYPKVDLIELEEVVQIVLL